MARAIKKRCSVCGKLVPLSKFYPSNLPMFANDGRINMCSECFADQCVNDDGRIDEDLFVNMLRSIDKPYYKDVLDKCVKQVESRYDLQDPDNYALTNQMIVNAYMSKIKTKKDSSYQESQKKGFVDSDNLRQQMKDSSPIQDAFESRVITLNDDNDFEVTEDMINLFGEGFTRNEYKKMYNKYEKLKINYTLQTNIHQETLATYVRFKVKEEDATAKGLVDEAKKWYDAAQNAAASGKLTPRQLSEADLHGGVNSLSDIFKAVEQATDVIPILPQFKYRPNDALDFVIWCYINYARDLEGMPPVEYSDVYKFYDKKKNEYINQYGDPYGIFSDEPDQDILRNSVNKFITLPKDYESMGETND